MVAWVVINRQHLPRAARGPSQPRKSRPIRALPLAARLFNNPTFKPANDPQFPPASIPILELTPPSSHRKSPPSFHALTWNPFCNPFVFIFMHVMGRGTPSSGLQPPIPYSQSPIPFLFKYVRTLLHFFALFCTHQKLNSFIFNQLRTLCKKHPGVWGTATAARFAEREAPC
jgi:hypothetical protein